jgi:hypothetical protein
VLKKNYKCLSKLAKKPEATKLIKIILLLVFLSFFTFGCAHLGKEPKEITINKDSNNRYQLYVNNKPFIIRGVCYSPIPIGQSYDYDFWQQDWAVFEADAKLMKEMGVNVIRVYQPGQDLKRAREVIRFFYERFGIRTITGHWLGFWDGPYPDYTNADFREEVKRQCLALIEEFKNEPGILLWILGNENNFSFGKERLRVWTSKQLEEISDPMKKRQAMAEIYYKFVNELAQEIKKIDKMHPVALGNGGLDNIEIAKIFSNNIDLLACSVYNGKSFGSAFSRIKNNWGKPFFFSEFGCDSFNALTKQPDENIQAEFIGSQWKEIKRNLAGGSGEGNALGGVIFEWSDEWWKHNEFDPSGYAVHDEAAGWSNGAYYFDIAAPGNLNMNEEWWGIVKQSLADGVPVRTPKKAYYLLQELWQQ